MKNPLRETWWSIETEVLNRLCGDAANWLQVRRDSKKYRDHATPKHCQYAASLGNAHAKELMDKYTAQSVTRRLKK